jgi:penicillin-binding protein 1A
MFFREYKNAEVLLENLDQKIAQFSSDTVPSVIVDSKGKELYRVQVEFRKVVRSIDEVPTDMRNAIVAAEDRRFWGHSGVDPQGMLRVLFTAARDRRFGQGGSTITMQLAKLLYSNSERTFRRKLQDLALAIAMERKLTKEQILLLYLNRAFFGQRANGVAAAAEVYFGKELKELTLGECAMLARCVQSPSRENPFTNLKKATDNRNLVLGIMRTEGMIDEARYQKALAEVPQLRKKRKSNTAGQIKDAPYFVQHVMMELEKEHNIDTDMLAQGGYRITTTLDPELNDWTEQQVRNIVRRNRGSGVTQAAFVLMDKDGRILAEVGGVDYQRSQFNIVTQGRRQPGSSFKPFVYGAAFAQGVLSPYDYLPNSRMKFRQAGGPAYSPRNSNGRYSDSEAVVTAFKWSMNVPAVAAISKVGPQQVINYANGAFGFTSRFQPYLSLALGAGEVSPLEMAQAYSVFMLSGSRATPYTITSIIAPDGETIAQEQPRIVPNVFPGGASMQVDGLLREVVESGTGHEAASIPNARGKTGTTSDNKDAWFCGYADGLVGIGWIGHEVIGKDGRTRYLAMDRDVFGGTVTVDLWRSVMSKAHDKYSFDLPTSKRTNINGTDESTKPVENPGDTPGDTTTGGDGGNPDPDPGTPATPPTEDPGTTGGRRGPGIDPDPEPRKGRDPGVDPPNLDPGPDKGNGGGGGIDVPPPEVNR